MAIDNILYKNFDAVLDHVDRIAALEPREAVPVFNAWPLQFARTALLAADDVIANHTHGIDKQHALERAIQCLDLYDYVRAYGYHLNWQGDVMLEQFTLPTHRFEAIQRSEMLEHCPAFPRELFPCSTARYQQYKREEYQKALAELRELEREAALASAMRTMVDTAERTYTSRYSDHLRSVVSIC